jgi:hypothetical protein
MKYFIEIALFVGISAISQIAYSGSISDTYATGDTLTADHLKNLKDAVNDNNSRITAIEASVGTDIAVDCIANPLALQNTTLRPGNTYVLTGMCNGPIRLSEAAGSYNFRGDDSGTKDDGIISPPGQTEGYVFSAYGPVSVSLENLTISGANYTSQVDAYVTTIELTGNASAMLNDVDVVGGDIGVWASSAYLSIGGVVNVTGFREEGLLAAYGGSIKVNDFITVQGALNEPGDYSTAMDALRNGSIVISGGGIFSAGGDDGTNPDYERGAMEANGNGTIRIRKSDVTLTGSIWAGRSSEITILSGGTIAGDISASDQSHVRIQNMDHSGGSISSTNGSGFTAFNSMLNQGSNADTIYVQGASTMTLGNTDVGNSSGIGSIEVAHHGFLSLQGTTNLNGRIINCADPVQDIQVFTPAGIGAGSCI